MDILYALLIFKSNLKKLLDFKKGSGYPISTFRFNLYSYNVNHLNIVTDVVSIGSF